MTQQLADLVAWLPVAEDHLQIQLVAGETPIADIAQATQQSPAIIPSL